MKAGTADLQRHLLARGEGPIGAHPRHERVAWRCVGIPRVHAGEVADQMHVGLGLDEFGEAHPGPGKVLRGRCRGVAEQQ